MMFRRVSRPVRLSAVIVATMFAVGITGGVLAQDETPTPNTIVTHPAHIHVGSCSNLDPNPMAPFNDVGPQMKDDKLPTSEDMKGSLTAAPVEYSQTEDVEASFDDILAEAHALNVHESAQNAENYIACGDIGGAVIDDTVTIGLQEQNGSGYTGVAIIEKDGDDHVKVTVYLTKVTEAAPTPEASPAP